MTTLPALPITPHRLLAPAIRRTSSIATRQVCLTGLLVLVGLVSSSPAEISVGIAQADITPPVGGLTTGYASAEPTEAVHDPVIARVLVLESQSGSVAIVVCDLCIYNSPWLHSQMQSVDIDQLLLLNTHTHAGPKLSEDFPSAEKPWRNTVDQRILSAITEAKANLFVGYFMAAEGQIQLGYNRLIQNGQFALTQFENPDRLPVGSVDPQVGVIRITDQSQTVRAVLVNYACHPVVLGPRNRQISADYPGVLRQRVEQQLDEGAICFFIQGAGGDINPLFMARGDSRDHDFDVVEKMGDLLSNEVLRTLHLNEDQPGRSESCKFLSSTREFHHRFDGEKTVALGVATLLINDRIAIVTLPGEPFHRFSLDLRQQAGLPHCYLFGYCSNGPYPWPSYLPDLLSAARGGYGASDTTRAEVGAGEHLSNIGLAQLFKLQGRLKSEPMRHTNQ